MDHLQCQELIQGLEADKGEGQVAVIREIEGADLGEEGRLQEDVGHHQGDVDRYQGDVDRYQGDEGLVLEETKIQGEIIDEEITAIEAGAKV
jgi:hypothetical protein